MPTIYALHGLEILDSRGRPTVQATLILTSGVVASASVPSGASTGSAEAHELRDGDPKRYRGLGCRKAAAHLSGEMNEMMAGRDFETQADFDRALIELDGTPDKSRLGANAVLAASLAFARACAFELGIPLYAHFADIAGRPLNMLPRPMINLFSGGKHADALGTIQDVQVMPLAARSIDEVLSITYDVFYTAAELVQRKFGMRLLRADEGGLAPDFPSAEAMMENAVDAIRQAGYRPGADVALTVDVAASHFYQDGVYQLGGEALDGAGMVDRLLRWLDAYPIASIEDGLAEDDWKHWALLREKAAGRTLILGDDLLCTNPARIQQAIERGASDALLLKVNQIGTLTEALEAAHLAKKANWKVVVSARSGETEDDWLADLAVGWGGDHIKIGSITQSERLAKYNRLLAIEAETTLSLR
jgi:enolase